MAGNPATLTNAGKGRPKGVPNKNTALLKDMILKALEGAGNKIEDGKGGLAYLIEQAEKNPAAFLTLVGKVLPLQIAGDPDAPLIVQSIQRTVYDPIPAAEQERSSTIQ